MKRGVKLLILLGFLFTNTGCFGQTVSNEVELSNKKQLPITSISLDSMWNENVFQKGGCLVGGQRVKNGRFGNEACVLTNRKENWRPFFIQPKDSLRTFLILQFADTATTKIHTCPCMPATNGEVAVYCLSKIYLTNWYDLEPFLAYRDKERTDCMNSEQAWLKALLADPQQRQLLIDEWMKM